MSIDGVSAHDRAADLLDSGDERELTPAARRRLRLGGGVLLIGIAIAAGGLEVHGRRQAAAEERRLAGLLELSLPEDPWRSYAEADSPSATSVTVTIRVPVRNDGPRPVMLTHASAGGFVIPSSPVRLGAQTTVEIDMQKTVRCDADSPAAEGPPDPLAAPGPLEITAETSRGTRTVTLERPPYDGEYAERSCGLLRGTPPPPT